MHKIRVVEAARMDSRAGIETFLIDLFRHMDKSLIQMDFLRTNYKKGPFDDEILKNGGRIYYITPINRNPLNIIRHFRDLRNFIKTNTDIEVFHSHGNTAISLINCCYAKKHKIKIVIGHSHNDYCGSVRSRIIHYVLRRLLSKSFDLRFACSESAWNWMFPHADKSNMHIIHNGIDVSKFVFSPEKRTEMRNKLGYQKEFVIGCVGRLTKQKNQIFLLKVITLMARRIPTARLLLIGDGEMREEIESYCKEHQLSNFVSITGFVANVPDYLQALDAFALPSLWEGLGICLIEAQAAGLPCIVSEAIVTEAIVTKNVKKISINGAHQEWADELGNIKNSFTRTDCSQEIIAKGYQLADSVKIVEHLYKMARN